MGLTGQERPEVRRMAELAKIHIAKKQLGLDDDTYRGAVRRIARGRTETAAELIARERAALLDHFKACGFKDGRGARARTKARRGAKTRKPAKPPHVRQLNKARALWRALWNLGATEECSERALDAFTKRQTGVATLRWCTPKQLNAVIEGLRGWCGRLGFAPPITQGAARDAKLRLVRAIWARLFDTGAVKAADGLDHWLHDRFLPGAGLPRCVTAEDLDEYGLDKAENALGERLRAAIGKESG